MNARKPFIVGLAGGSGSGKTTLSRIIASALPWDVAIVPLDRFYKDLSHLSRAQRLKYNFDIPESLLMDDAFTAIRSLSFGLPTPIPHYDFDSCLPLPEPEVIQPTEIVMLEGMHALHHDELLQIYDLSIFLDIDEPTRFQRKVERDIRERNRTYENVVQMWNDFTKPMHDVYVQPAAQRADLRFTDTFTPGVIAATTEAIQQKFNWQTNLTTVIPH